MKYEAEECSKNIFYLGAAPNQQATEAIDFLMSPAGGNRTRFVLLGTDYVYPRTTNNILYQYLKDRSIAEQDIMVTYTTFGWSDW